MSKYDRPLTSSLKAGSSGKAVLQSPIGLRDPLLDPFFEIPEQDVLRDLRRYGPRCVRHRHFAPEWLIIAPGLDFPSVLLGSTFEKLYLSNSLLRTTLNLIVPPLICDRLMESSQDYAPTAELIQDGSSLDDSLDNNVQRISNIRAKQEPSSAQVDTLDVFLKTHGSSVEVKGLREDSSIAEESSTESVATSLGRILLGRVMKIANLGDPMDFVSMGMLIIDDVYYSDPRPPVSNTLGGAGTYATMGARLFRDNSPSNVSGQKAVGYVVHAGQDFAASVRSEIESWSSGTVIVETPERLTTRGKNVYRGGIRDFQFLSPKMQVDPTMLNNHMKLSKTYHLICDPARCIELVKGIMAERDAILNTCERRDIPTMLFFSKPIIVWEPMEGSCRPTELSFFLEALQYVDVFSPNAHELTSLFMGPENLGHDTVAEKFLVSRCKELLTVGFGSKPSAIVVRMGANGCMVGSLQRFSKFSAYYAQPVQAECDGLENLQESHKKVVDVTGGGNAFLGGFCIGLLARQTHHIDHGGLTDFELAAQYGSVAASFAIEQVGMPKLSHRKEDGKELWNGEIVQERMHEISLRVLFLELPLFPVLSEEQLKEASLFEPATIHEAGQRNSVSAWVRKGDRLS